MTRNNPVAIQTIALKLAATNNVKSKLINDEYVVTSEYIKQKIKALESLNNVPLVKFRLYKDNLSYTIPTIYRDEKEIAIVNCDTSRSINKDFKIVSWQGGNVNKAVISNGEVDLEVAIAFNDDALDDFKTEYDNDITGQGVEGLKAHWLKERPRVELPLREMKVGVKYKVVNSKAGVTKEYKTIMIDIETEKGEIIYNVITNSELRNLIDSGCEEFKITAINEYQQEYSDGRNKQTKIRICSKVLIEPIDDTDFSDF